MSRVLGVIPARLGSTRLPEKPLQLLLGVPLVVWVLDRTRHMPVLDRVVVATDDERIAQVCREWGGEVALTRPDHPSGTDRVWEVVQSLAETFEVVVNVQGDEPLIEPSTVAQAVAQVHDGFDVGTCATQVASEAEFHDPSVVKVVRASNGTALYFSRAPIPYRRDPDGTGHPPSTRLRHVGVYAYSVDALERWVRLEPSPLEREERLEQLRALEAGLTIGVGLVSDRGVGVDTAADLVRVEEGLRTSGVSAPARRGGNQANQKHEAVEGA